MHILIIGIEIDRCKNVGLSRMLKGYVSLTPNQIHFAENAGWHDADLTDKIANEGGYFDVTIPLSMILSFAEDYRKIIDRKIQIEKTRYIILAFQTNRKDQRKQFANFFTLVAS